MRLFKMNQNEAIVSPTPRQNEAKMPHCKIHNHIIELSSTKAMYLRYTNSTRPTKLALQYIQRYDGAHNRESSRKAMYLRYTSNSNCDYVIRIFLETTNTPAMKKKELTPFESFGCTRRELHTKFQLEMREIALGKTFQSRTILSAGPARMALESHILLLLQR